MPLGNIRDTSTTFWQTYGVRARIKCKTLTECVERVRAIVGRIKVPYKITIISPKKSKWIILANLKLERSNCKRIY